MSYLPDRYSAPYIYFTPDHATTIHTMFAGLCFLLLAAAGSCAPVHSGASPSQPAHVVYLGDDVHKYPVAPQGAQLAYVVGVTQPQQYQVARFQPAQYDTSYIQYVQPQEQQVQVQSYKAPTFSAAAPKPLARNYQVHEAHQEPHWAIVRQSLDNNFDGHFQYDYETENGISVRTLGAARQLSPKEQGQGIQGSYSYTAPDGRQITTSYTADENGFVATGDHLPVAPEVPELPPLIAKSLAYIFSQPPQPENQQ